MTTTATPGRDTLLEGLIQDAISILHHDTTEGSKVDKYERECLRKKFSARLAAKPSDEGVREEAAYAAYLGICVLATMCKKAGLSLAEKRATELLIEMGNAFPSFAGRSALRSLSTTGEPKR